MKLPQPCQCGAIESHGYKYQYGRYSCADCVHISPRVEFNSKTYKKQAQVSQKDLLQPFKYSTSEKKVIPNKDFIKVYGKKKFEQFAPKL